MVDDSSDPFNSYPILKAIANRCVPYSIDSILDNDDAPHEPGSIYLVWEERLLEKAVPMSTLGQDVRGKPLKILSPEMQEVFGGFGGKVSFQRSPTRWVDAGYINRAAEFDRSLP